MNIAYIDCYIEIGLGLSQDVRRALTGERMHRLGVSTPFFFLRRDKRAINALLSVNFPFFSGACYLAGAVDVNMCVLLFAIERIYSKGRWISGGQMPIFELGMVVFLWACW